MAIHVRASPVVLSWSDFTPVVTLPGKEEAHTKVGFTLENKNFVHKDGVYALADVTLTVTPSVQVLKTANQTADLLSHEQGHYNIGILVGRAMARELEKLWDQDPKKLADAAGKVYDKHRLTLMKPVQDSYDGDADGSRNAAGQAKWDKLIADALGSATVVLTLNNLPL